MPVDLARAHPQTVFSRYGPAEFRIWIITDKTPNSISEIFHIDALDQSPCHLDSADGSQFAFVMELVR